MSDVTLNIKGLQQLAKALKKKPPTVRVGILAGKSARKSSGSGKKTPTNAEVGAVHEYGSPARGLPQRSFLRVPISDRLQKEMDQSGAFKEQTMKDVLKEGSVVPWMRKVAVLAEGIVAGAFASGGYGKWAPWKTKNYSNNAGQLLVDTKQLRESVTSEVKE